MTADEVKYCPHCNADLTGDEIPENIQHLFNATHYSRKIGYYDTEEDRTVSWQCPNCNRRWEVAKY